jgi:MFS family permease
VSIAQRNVRFFFWAALFGSVSFIEPILTLFYKHRGLTPTEIMFALTAFSGTMLLFEVPTGAFADRYGPKRAFLVGSLIQVLSTVVLIYADTAWLVFLSRSLFAVSITFFSGADEALIYESLKEEGQESTMDAVMGKISSAGFIASLVTQLVGAFLAADLSESQFVLVLWCTAGFQVVQVLLLLGIVNPKSFAQFRDNPFANVKKGLQVIRTTPDLLKLFLNVSVCFIPTYVFASFDQPYFTDAGLPPEYLGVLYASAALVSLLLSRNVAWFTRRFSRVFLMYATGFVSFAAILVAALVHDQVLVALLAFYLVRGARTLRNPIYSHMQNEYIPSGARATTLSLLSVLDSVLDLLIVPPLAVWIAPFGRPWIFAACAGVILLGLVCFRVKEAPRQTVAD